jgi:hypothetical protein
VGVLPFADAAARTAAIPTPTDGQFTYLQDTNTPEFYNGSAFQAIGGGKVLQVVLATDTTSRTTTSGTYVDVTGMSVTITPQQATSAILFLVSLSAVRIERSGSGSMGGWIQLTDSSNNAVSGGERAQLGSLENSRLDYSVFFAARATPATTSAVTYKLRFLAAVSGSTIIIGNNLATGQLYAIEVSA